MIGDWKLPPLLGLQVIGGQHEVCFFNLVDYQGLVRYLGILSRDLDVHDLVFRALKIELLSVPEVWRETL